MQLYQAITLACNCFMYVDTAVDLSCIDKRWTQARQGKHTIIFNTIKLLQMLYVHQYKD